MKKITAVLMIALLAVCFMTGCGEEKVTPNLSPYDQLDYAEYVELPDYMSFEFKAEPVEISDDQVQAEIDSRLKAASTETNEITEGKVEKGGTLYKLIKAGSVFISDDTSKIVCKRQNCEQIGFNIMIKQEDMKNECTSL